MPCPSRLTRSLLLAATPVVITNFVAEDVDDAPEDLSLNVIMTVDAGTLDLTTLSSPVNAVSFTYTPPLEFKKGLYEMCEIF